MAGGGGFLGAAVLLPPAGGPLAECWPFAAACADFGAVRALAEVWGTLTVDSGVRPGDREPGPASARVLFFWGALLAPEAALFSSGAGAAPAGPAEGTGTGCFVLRAELTFCAGTAPACRAPPGGCVPRPLAVAWELGFVVFAEDWKGDLGLGRVFALGPFGHLGDESAGASRLQETGSCLKNTGSVFPELLLGGALEVRVRGAGALGVLEAAPHRPRGSEGPGLLLGKVSGAVLLPRADGPGPGAPLGGPSLR